MAREVPRNGPNGSRPGQGSDQLTETTEMVLEVRVHVPPDASELRERTCAVATEPTSLSCRVEHVEGSCWIESGAEMG